MDFMRRGCSPLSLTQMQSKVNGITPLQIKLKLLGVLPYRINMQVRADSSDTNDSRHCPIIKGCTLCTMTIVQHWPSHETHAICMARTHALLSPCACGTTLQARQGVAPQAERFFCVLNALWQAATAGEQGRSHQSTKKTPERALNDECASKRESAAKVCCREGRLGGRVVGLRPSLCVHRIISAPLAMGRRPKYICTTPYLWTHQ